MIIILNTIICFNNSDEIVEYVNKLHELNNSDLLAVSVIINDSKTNANELEKKLQNIGIRCLVTKASYNLGYLNGMVEAVKQFLQKYQVSIKWIVMSNTDISYPDKDIFKKLISTNYDKDIWCIGPSVYVPYKKAFDNPVLTTRRSLFAVNKIIFVHSIPILRLLYQWASGIKTRLIKTCESESGFVYEVHGCYFLISYELYEEILNNPYKSFMYSEEAFIAETIYHKNKKSYFDSNLRIEHNEHSVTSTLKLRRIAKFIASSMKDIKKEFYKY
ncbi:MAG: hypothetical protein J5631_00180 [Spirochaetaceae bacterium]|nr:hypothetical protein [Spirochaetaceae bacterium]